MTKTTAAVAARYLRISEDKADDEHGIHNQDELTAMLAATGGYALADCHGPGCEPGLFLDNDISASKAAHRPGYAALMTAVERGDLDGGYILCYQMSRLWRNRTERAHGMALLQKHSVSVIAVKGLSADLTTSYGRLVADVMGSVDSWESDVKAERVSDAQRAQVKAGLHPGGHRPFGFDLRPDPARKDHPDPAHRGRLVKPAIHKSEGAALRKVAAGLLAGRTLASQVRYLNEQHTTTWGGPWTPASLVRTLRRERNYGTVTFNGEMFTEGGYTTGPFADDLDDPGPYQKTAWPALWSEATHRKLCAVLDDPGRVTNHARSNKLKSLLSSVAVCGRCGAHVKSSTKEARGGGRRHVYRCTNDTGDNRCPGVFRSREAVDYVVTEWLLRQLQGMHRDQRVKLLSGPGDNSGPWQEKARECRVKMDKLIKTYLEGVTPEGLYRSNMTSLKAQLASAEKNMAAHSRSPVVGDLLLASDIRAAWEQLPLDRKRAVLRELVWVTIHPAVPGKTLRTRDDWTPQGARITVAWNLEAGDDEPFLAPREPLPGERERDDDYLPD